MQSWRRCGGGRGVVFTRHLERSRLELTRHLERHYTAVRPAAKHDGGRRARHGAARHGAARHGAAPQAKCVAHQDEALRRNLGDRPKLEVAAVGQAAVVEGVHGPLVAEAPDQRQVAQATCARRMDQEERQVR